MADRPPWRPRRAADGEVCTNGMHRCPESATMDADGSAARRGRLNAQDQERLRAVCADVVGIDPVDLEAGTDFFQDLNIDRDDLADMFVAIEDAFDISLEDGIGAVRTFEDLEVLVDDQLSS
jgi:acyl carrier protein